MHTTQTAKALKMARKLIVGEIEQITDGYWEGGALARKRNEGGISIEGRYYVRPWRAALKAIDAALTASKGVEP